MLKNLLKLFDLFYEAEILKDIVMTLMIYG